MSETDYSTYFKAVAKGNPDATKVLFYLTSYRAPWFVYSLAIRKLQKAGYEIVVYDFKDSVLDNDNPYFLPKFIEVLCKDMQSRVASYQNRGIGIFDGVGNSLGSFLLYNYTIRFPLRKIALNMVSYMSLVIFTSKDSRITKTRNTYLKQGFDLPKLQKAWETIDSPKTGKELKSDETMLFTALNDKYVTPESAQMVIDNIKISPTKLVVYKNLKLGHNASTVKNAHSKAMLEFFLK